MHLSWDVPTKSTTLYPRTRKRNTKLGEKEALEDDGEAKDNEEDDRNDDGGQNDEGTDDQDESE